MPLCFIRFFVVPHPVRSLFSVVFGGGWWRTGLQRSTRTFIQKCFQRCKFFSRQLEFILVLKIRLLWSYRFSKGTKQKRRITSNMRLLLKVASFKQALPCFEMARGRNRGAWLPVSKLVTKFQYFVRAQFQRKSPLERLIESPNTLRFWATDGNQKWVVFLFSLSWHYPSAEYLFFKNLGQTTVVPCEMFTGLKCVTQERRVVKLSII